MEGVGLKLTGFRLVLVVWGFYWPFLDISRREIGWNWTKMKGVGLKLTRFRPILVIWGFYWSVCDGNWLKLGQDEGRWA